MQIMFIFESVCVCVWVCVWERERERERERMSAFLSTCICGCFVCVCIFVCVSLWGSVFVHLCVHIFACCEYTYMHLHIMRLRRLFYVEKVYSKIECVFIWVTLFACVSGFLYLCYFLMCVCVSLCVWVHICVSVFVCTSISVSVSTCVYACIIFFSVGVRAYMLLFTYSIIWRIRLYLETVEWMCLIWACWLVIWVL